MKKITNLENFNYKKRLYPDDCSLFNLENFDCKYYVKESDNYYLLSTGNYPLEFFSKQTNVNGFINRINEHIEDLKDELLSDNNYQDVAIDDYIRDLESFSGDLQAKLDFENMNADEKKRIFS